MNETVSQHERIMDLLGELSVEEKASLLIASSPGIPRLAINKYYHGNEALHGIVRPGKFTVFPQAIALASMWNKDLHYQVATAISDEARARWNELEQGEKQTLRFNDLLTFWSPTINMARDPRWGRTPETYGEDPYLAGALATQFVKGLQGNDPKYIKVVATPKHFAANNEETNRFSCNAVISMRMLREYYLPAYEMAIKDGKAASIMAAYNAINGVPSGANPWLLTKVLREDWGFKGYVVSDCGGPSNLVTAHQYVKTKELAAMVSLKAGLDLECGDNIYKQPLLNAYQQGMVSLSDIDTAAYRVLRARMQLGLFDNPANNPYNKISPSVVGSAKHQALALEAARQGIVLLKNEQGILPLNAAKLKSIAVVGINAGNTEFGDYSGEPVVAPVSILKGIQNKVGKQVKINYAEWQPINGLEGYALIGKEFFPEGLKAAYFSNMTLEGVGKKRIDPQVNFEPANQPPDAFLPTGPLSIQWEGKLKPSISGKYSLGFLSHDGCRLTINGKLVIDSWKRKATVTEFADIVLEAGKVYDFKAEYFVRRDAVAKLYWKTPDVDFNVTSLFKEAIAAAKKSEITVAVLGMNKNFEREGQDRNQIGLSKDQEIFIKEIKKANPKTIVVFVAGSSLAIDWVDQNIPAILDAWYPGEQGGTAVADVLFGDYNPAGRLPLTFYKSMDDLLPFNDYDVSKGRTYQYFKGNVLYPFGFGLSYTSFVYSDLQLTKTENSINVIFNLKNSGKRDGDEVAQVYVKMPESGIILPIKQLKGFKRVHLENGKTEKVEIAIDKTQLRYWDEKTSSFITPKGTYNIMVGASSNDIKLN
ncbi:MAG TPA: glycoside hydrolase family 3 C-terminal domain-containing protein, partial [Sediminibacterium sp.]|nr:glycoside hydrolase family 3 C-terminal domain-containing protein [Sediminibacterium sp.]